MFSSANDLLKFKVLLECKLHLHCNIFFVQFLTCNFPIAIVTLHFWHRILTLHSLLCHIAFVALNFSHCNCHIAFVSLKNSLAAKGARSCAFVQLLLSHCISQADLMVSSSNMKSMEENCNAYKIQVEHNNNLFQ